MEVSHLFCGTERKVMMSVPKSLATSSIVLNSVQASLFFAVCRAESPEHNRPIAIFFILSGLYVRGNPSRLIRGAFPRVCSPILVILWCTVSACPCIDVS